MDFDGTISTLRQGWEDVMLEVMLGVIGGITDSAAHEAAIRAYISESTGVQTIFQMDWFVEYLQRIVDETQGDYAVLDAWDYKDMYNAALMRHIEGRIADAAGNAARYCVPGSIDFLRALKAAGIAIYLASGTDEADVRREAELLGVTPYVTDIRGAAARTRDCGKEYVLAQLIEGSGIKGKELIVIGDGRVEIELGAQHGALTLGMATDEIRIAKGDLGGVNLVKRDRLIKAGADAIAPDFTDIVGLTKWAGIARADSKFAPLDIGGIKLDSATTRHNLVRIDNLKNVADKTQPYDEPCLSELAQRIKDARKNGRPVIWSHGAHVIKNGLSRYIIDLIQRGLLTHISGNGACSIHDFELAMLGGTSEDVKTAIQDGSFGMWQETLYHMNQALALGRSRRLGYGESLAVYIDEHADLFPHRDDCVLYQAYAHEVPATFHIALGTDIIHQSPDCDMGGIGDASGIDFKLMCKSVSQLDGGVFLNFGSGIIGPEVFLKALSIARNLGYPTFDIACANFDLVDLGDYHADLGYDDTRYYYRPRKNIVLRPTANGGWGHHFCGDHNVTIPALYRLLV